MKKHILITGSTDGIGKLAAIKLAQDGHHVILHGRKPEKLAKVLEEIRTENPAAEVAGVVADFAKLDEVRQMAKEVQDAYPKIDVLINNAGVFNSPAAQAPNGLEVRYVVNYFAPYVLTQALLPQLQQSDEARIVNLSSAAQTPVNYEVLRGQTAAQSARDAYGQSKLAITMWSFQLAAQYPAITVTALNPGSLLNTKMVQEAFGQYWSSADKGAQIIYDLAVAPKYKGVTGRYFDNDQGDFGPAHADAYQSAAIEKLMTATEEVLSGLA
ncbi:MAG: SDR family NAD(P)-dependent oxidoreductase [Bacteroidota bacterium]